MDLQTLKLFMTVAQEGSISKAAQKLRYAQSNLSTRMLQLEHEMNTPLFFRTRQGVTLTPKGILLKKYAFNLLTMADEAEQVLKNEEIICGTLAIGSMESTASTILPTYLKAFREKYPSASVKVETGATEPLLKKVLEHSLDGAFVAGPIPYEQLRSVSLRTETMVLLSNYSADDDLPYSELLKQPFLVFPEGCSYRRAFLDWSRQEGYFPTQILEFNSLSAILASVSAGLGVALFPETVAAPYVQNGTLRSHAIPDAAARRETHFVWKEDTYISPLMQSFIDLMK